MSRIYSRHRAAKYLNQRIKLNTGNQITGAFMKRLNQEGRLFPARKWPVGYSKVQLDEYLNEVKPR